jgi:hypothetical protein
VVAGQSRLQPGTHVQATDQSATQASASGTSPT